MTKIRQYDLISKMGVGFISALTETKHPKQRGLLNAVSQLFIKCVYITGLNKEITC